MKIINLNKYHSILIFFFSVIFCFINLNLNYDLAPLICFFLIATLGVSHGALDNLKGFKLLKKFNIKNNFYFYLSYIILALFIVALWSLLPAITLIFFLFVASFHFGKEDNIFGYNKKTKFLNFLLFLKGSLVVSAPMYFNFDETAEIFQILDANINDINDQMILIMIILSLLSNFFISKNILFSFLDSLSIVLLNYTFDPLIAFTVYFCFLHSIRHAFSIINEINKSNFNKGLTNFIKLALPLTVITGIFFMFSVYYLNHFYLLNSAILKVIFIGLASLTFPHILLEYLLEKNEKKS
jgi:beta-carotene 15,15'-dioxygenase